MLYHWSARIATTSADSFKAIGDREYQRDDPTGPMLVHAVATHVS
jgi:hypothetical protein